jgi:glycosyltransferase involved in cell wall biosynthesis
VELSDKPHIIFVNLEFPPLAGPGVWRVLGLSKYLAGTGYSVSVVCSDRSVWHKFRDESLLESLPPGIDVHRQPSHFLADLQSYCETREQRAHNALTRWLWKRLHRLLGRYIPDKQILWALRSIGPTLARVRKHANACVITTGPPHVAHLVGLVVKWRTNCRWIMDYRDLWTSDPVQVYRGGPYQRRLFKWLERRCLRRCDAVVTVAPAWRGMLHKICGLNEGLERFHIIRNGHDLSAGDISLFHPVASADARLRIHYSGTVQENNKAAINIFFNALRLIKESQPAIRLPIVTFTGLPIAAHAEIERLGIADMVSDLGYLPRAAAMSRCASADVLLVAVNLDDTLHRGTIPAKTYEAMAFGKHVFALLPTDSDVKPLLEEYGSATVLEVPTMQQVAAALIRLLMNRSGETGRSADEDARRWAWLEKFSRQSLARDYGTLVESLSHEAK